jgi:hypothetical protein
MERYILRKFKMEKDRDKLKWTKRQTDRDEIKLERERGK